MWPGACACEKREAKCKMKIIRLSNHTDKYSLLFLTLCLQPKNEGINRSRSGNAHQIRPILMMRRNMRQSIRLYVFSTLLIVAIIDYHWSDNMRECLRVTFKFQKAILQRTKYNLGSDRPS